MRELFSLMYKGNTVPTVRRNRRLLSSPLMEGAYDGLATLSEHEILISFRDKGTENCSASS